MFDLLAVMGSSHDCRGEPPDMKFDSNADEVFVFCDVKEGRPDNQEILRQRQFSTDVQVSHRKPKNKSLSMLQYSTNSRELPPSEERWLPRRCRDVEANPTEVTWYLARTFFEVAWDCSRGFLSI